MSEVFMLNLRLNRRPVVFICIMLFNFISLTLTAIEQDNFKVVNHNNSQIDLKFETGSWNLETMNELGIEYKTIKSNAKNNLFIDEVETLPIYSALVAIPEGMDVELITDIRKSKDVQSVNLLQKQIIDRVKGSADSYPQKQFIISEPGQFRDIRVVNINVCPFQFNTHNNNLKVIESADIRLRLVPSLNGSTNLTAGVYSSTYDNLYSSLIINYNNIRDELVPITQPKLLIIYPSSGDATFLAKLNEFVTWKKQKGYVVNAASTSVAGTSTSSIKSYITNQYNNITTRPDAVLLIGDPSTGLVVPTFSGEYGDHPYTLISGSDEFSDIQLGRISVENNSQFATYIAKVMFYERDIYIPTAGWLNRMLLVGDSAHSGISTYYTNYYIRNISSAANPNYSYTELLGSYGNVLQSAIDTGINQGVGFFNYRGYIGVSGWSPNSSTTINGTKLNHGVIITCDTGTFYSGTSRTESYIRLGTESVPAGGVTAIGMSTSSTHTGANNFLSSAIFDGIFNNGYRSMGEALLFSKTYLQSVYGMSGPTLAYNFNRYCNLMGDPTVEVYITIPKTFQLTAPSSIIPGTIALELIVKDESGNPVQNATVNASQTGCNLTAYTDSQGKVIFSLPSNLSGSLNVSVSKHDFKPLVQTYSITGTGLIYQNSLIDDDNIGNSLGNNNQIINAGETIEYKAQIKNTGTTSINSITGTVSCSDPFIQLTTSTINFPIAFAGSTVTSLVANEFTVSQECPDNHPITLNINGTSSAGAWSVSIPLIVNSPDLDYQSYTITGTNSYLDIGENTTIYVSIQNNGDETASSVYGVLRSLDDYVQVTDSLKYFGDINASSVYSNSSNPFGILANGLSINGMTIPMELYLYNSSGYNDTEAFTLTIGNQSVNDPLGQDAYGYFIFDDGDVDYIQCPTYNWIGITPIEGGSGTPLAITDSYTSSDEGDQVGCDASEFVSLPFTFNYYGISYDYITVVSNGFLAFGITNDHSFRNGRLPGAMGPNTMIAPFWDDLATGTGSGIYKYYDAVNHSFIIEWYNMKNGYNGSSEETFQVILYDPNYYLTSTNDGPIKIQYKVFNNVDSYTGTTSHGNYCTVGIKDHTGTIGLEYTYNNQYPAAARTITNQSALYITTAPLPPEIPYISIGQKLLYDSNSNGYFEARETIDVRLRLDNAGINAATNVSAVISESDPWINILQNTASFGNVPGLGNTTNTSGFLVEVLDGCPNDYIATVNVTITASGGYTWHRTFDFILNTPVVNIIQTIIHDYNDDGIVEPGENFNVGLKLNNTGLVNADDVSATLTESDPYITIIQNTSLFGNLDSQAETINQSYYIVYVASDCPANHTVLFTAIISASNYSVNKSFAVTVRKPSIALNSWAIDDLIGNGNNVVDISETGYLVLNLYNSQQINATNVVINLSSSNSNFVITPTQITTNTIEKLYTFQTSTQYQTNSLITNGTNVTVSVNVSYDNAPDYNTDINIIIGGEFSSMDFETDNGGFTYSNSVSPGWEWGTSTYAGAHSGSKIWGCVLSGNYSNNATYELVSPSINLSANPVLSFWHRYNLEISGTGTQPYDGGRVMISTNDGLSWSRINPSGGYPWSSIPVFGGTAGYSGYVNNWSLASFNLSAYASQTIKLKWEMKSDGGTTYQGWFIDDVNITSLTNGVISGIVTLVPDVGDITDVAVTTNNIKVNPDITGLYKFRLTAGTYTIKGNLAGFTEKTRNATVAMGSTVSNINMTLEYLACPINFSWSAQTNAVYLKWGIDTRPTFLHYNIYRRKGTDTWEQIDETTQPNYVDILNQETWYDYKITSHFNTGESQPTNIIHVVYPNDYSTPPPVSPSNIYVTKSAGNIVINWSEVTQDINSNPIVPWEYRVYGSSEPDFIPSVDNYLSTTTSTSYNFDFSTAGEEHFFIIKAIIGFLE